MSKIVSLIILMGIFLVVVFFEKKEKKMIIWFRLTAGASHVYRMETIDNLITNYNMQKIKLIKCDVEGAELFVIKGAINTIKKYSPIVLLEIVRNHTERYNYSPIDLLQFMMSLDYKIFVLSDGKLVETSSVTKNVINYFFVPNTVNVTSLS